MASAAQFIADHWGTLEADFQRFYGIDLRTACFGPDPVSFRRIVTLMRWLPSESATVRDTHPETRWTELHELVAAHLELTHAHYVAFISANSRKGTRLPEPLQVPRPYDKPEPRKRPATGDELAAFLRAEGLME